MSPLATNVWLGLLKVAEEAPKAPAANDPTTEIIIAALGAGGFGAIIAAIVTGLFSKKKLGAEATEIITKAASGVVERLEAELARRVEDMAAMRLEHKAEVEKITREHSDEREEWRRVLQLHVAWDAIAIAKMGEIGIELPPAPPLLPPIDRR